MSEYDEFIDVKNSSLGIFGEGALQDHDAVKHKVVRDGVNFEFECAGCGRSTRITVEWPELVAIKYGHNPAIVFARYPQIVDTPMSWTYRPQEEGWAPDAKCPHCGFTFALRMAPGEPEAYLKAGRRANFINPAGEQQVSAICTAAAQNPGAGWALPRQR
jgi:hypothetical protein